MSFEVQQHIQELKAGFKKGALSDVNQRKKALKLLAQILRRDLEVLAEAIYKDFKKSKFDLEVNELLLLEKEIKNQVKHLNARAKKRRVKTNAINWPAWSYLKPQAKGTVLVIGAWNYPLLLSLQPAVAALAAGNTVLVKPSELTPHFAKALEQSLNQSELKEVLRVVNGGPEVVQEMIAADLDHVFFTGSTAVGKIIGQQCIQNFTSYSLELGGKNPTIIDDPKSLKLALQRIIWAKALNAGQTCIAPDYLLVHETLKPTFQKTLNEVIENHPGPLENVADHYPQIVNEHHFKRLQDLLEEVSSDQYLYQEAIKERERFMGLQVLEIQDHENALMQEEIFGPILPVLFYKGTVWQDWIQKTPFPLATYIFTSNQNHVHYLEQHWKSGALFVNDLLLHITNESLPFGGVRSSGLGAYHGAYGFAEFSDYLPIMKKIGPFEISLKYQPQTTSKLKWIRRFFKYL